MYPRNVLPLSPTAYGKGIKLPADFRLFVLSLFCNYLVYCSVHSCPIMPTKRHQAQSQDAWLILKIRHISNNGQVAQSVEQRTENPRVGCSIHPLATIILGVFSPPPLAQFHTLTKT